MEKGDRFINEVLRIVTGALRLDIDRVRNYTLFLAEKLEKEGEVQAATRLRSALQENDRQLKPVGVSFAQALPVDSDTRFPLVELIPRPAEGEIPLVLSGDQWEIVNEFLSVAKNYGRLDSESIPGSINLLMYGPPGTGKSRLARHIAAELGVDLYVARLDGLISSFLGSTSKNIRALFDFAARTPCVLFLDEFDAIAKLRGDHHELGELKRVVNSFIQNLDALGSQSIVLAATNHEELLDAAIWRRFAYRLELTYPQLGLRRQLWAEFSRSLEFSSRDLDLLADLSEGFSGSDIQEVCRRLQRRKITGIASPEVVHAFQALQNLGIGEGADRRFLSALRGRETNDIASALRDRNEKLYSHAALADLLGISKATAYRKTLKRADTHGRRQKAGR